MAFVSRDRSHCAGIMQLVDYYIHLDDALFPGWGMIGFLWRFFLGPTVSTYSRRRLLSKGSMHSFVLLLYYLLQCFHEWHLIHLSSSTSSTFSWEKTNTFICSTMTSFTIFCSSLSFKFLLHWKTCSTSKHLGMSIFDSLMHYFVVILVITILITPLWRLFRGTRLLDGPHLQYFFFLVKKKCIYLKVDCLCPTGQLLFLLFILTTRGHFISVLFFHVSSSALEEMDLNMMREQSSRSNNVIHTDSISQCVFVLENAS